jgi:hypothetical protein
MTPRHLFIGTLAISLLNGWISPLFQPLAFFAPIWLPSFVPPSPIALAYASSMIIAAGTLLAAGVPAAIVERIRKQAHSDQVSMIIWLAGAIILTLPGLPRLAAAL